MLFNYFAANVVQTMMPLSSWTKASQSLIGLAMHKPHAMHSILAISGCHYRSHRKARRQRCTSEYYHSIKASIGLRQCLDSPQADEMDAALITSMVLGTLAFADTTEDFDIPLIDRPVPFFWLGKQIGCNSLLTLFQARVHRQSMWISMFEEIADAVLRLEDNRTGAEGIPAALAAMFDVQKDSDCATHPYLRVLRRLCGLMSVAPEHDTAFVLYLQFVEAMSSQFIGLLNDLDTRALMLLAYWLALLGAKDCWWSRSRAMNDCYAICAYLEKYGNKSMWAYMDFPATTCGYPYKGDGLAGQWLVAQLRLETL